MPSPNLTRRPSGAAFLPGIFADDTHRAHRACLPYLLHLLYRPYPTHATHATHATYATWLPYQPSVHAGGTRTAAVRRAILARPDAPHRGDRVGHVCFRRRLSLGALAARRRRARRRPSQFFGHAGISAVFTAPRPASWHADAVCRGGRTAARAAAV